MAVVALRRTSVTVMLFPEETVPEGPSHWAEGMLVRPVMTSRTVQVRVSSPLPASTGPSTETSVITSRAPGGTGGGAVSSYCSRSVLLYWNLPTTAISTVLVYTVPPAVSALHVYCCP